MCLSEMGIAAEIFLWALCSVAVEMVANKFGFIRIEKVRYVGIRLSSVFKRLEQ